MGATREPLEGIDALREEECVIIEQFRKIEGEALLAKRLISCKLALAKAVDAAGGVFPLRYTRYDSRRVYY